MIYVNKELIDKELKLYKELGFEFSYEELSYTFINKIFKQYKLMEMCEDYYDSEPNIDDEELDMYLEYKEKIKYGEYEHIQEELKDVYDKVVKIYENYEQDRLKWCNWQELHFEGNWSMSQKYVNSLGEETLRRIMNCPEDITDRFYVAQKDDELRIYFYGRDIWKVDYWFIFKKENRGEEQK